MLSIQKPVDPHPVFHAVGIRVPAADFSDPLGYIPRLQGLRPGNGELYLNGHGRLGPLVETS